MRPASALFLTLGFVAVVALAPTLAQAAGRIHVAHSKHHRGRGDPAAAPAAPVSDVPDAIWASSHNRR